MPLPLGALQAGATSRRRRDAGGARVHLLVRGPVASESAAGAASCVSVQGRVATVADTVVSGEGPKRPDFGSRTAVSVALDGCFDAQAEADSRGAADPGEVYSEVGAPLVSDVRRGYDAVLVVRGGAGSGKSHAVHGVPSAKGIVPRAVSALLASDGVRGVDVAVYAVLEGGRWSGEGGVVDLLAPEALCGSRKQGALKYLAVRPRPAVQGLAGAAGFVEGLCTVAADSDEGFERVAALAAHTRHLLAGARGTRGWHEVVHVTVRRRDPQGLPSGSLRVVEVAHRSRAALDRCLAALSVHASMAHRDDGAEATSLALPVRESPLTWLLADAMAGQTRLGFLVCASPSTVDRPVTLAELRFAAQCRGIADKAAVGETDDALAAHLNAEVDELKSALVHAGGDSVRAARLRADIRSCKILLAPLEQPFEARLSSNDLDRQYAVAKAHTGLLVRTSETDPQMRTQSRLVLIDPSAALSGLLCYIVPAGTSRIIDLQDTAEGEECLRIPGPLVDATLAYNPATGSATLATAGVCACSINGTRIATDGSQRLLQNGDRIALGSVPIVLVYVAPGAESPGLHAPTLEALWHSSLAAHRNGFLEDRDVVWLEAGLESAFRTDPGTAVDIQTLVPLESSEAEALRSDASAERWRALDSYRAKELEACGRELHIACREARQLAEACGREVEYTLRIGRRYEAHTNRVDSVASDGPSLLGLRAKDAGFTLSIIAKDVTSGVCNFFGADEFVGLLPPMRSVYASVTLTDNTSSVEAHMDPSSGLDTFTGVAVDVLRCRAPVVVDHEAERLKGEVQRLSGEVQRAKSVSSVGADSLRALRAKVTASEEARASAEARLQQSEAELRLSEEAKQLAMDGAAKTEAELREARAECSAAQSRASALEKKLHDVAGSEDERVNAAELRLLEESQRADALAAQLQRFGGKAEVAEERVSELEAKLLEAADQVAEFKRVAESAGRDVARRLAIAEAEMRKKDEELENRDQRIASLEAAEARAQESLQLSMNELAQARVRAKESGDEAMALSQRLEFLETERQVVRDAETLTTPRGEDASVQRIIELEAQVMHLSDELAAELARQQHASAEASISGQLSREEEQELAAKAAELERLNEGLRQELSLAHRAQVSEGAGMNAPPGEKAVLEKQVADLGKLVKRATEELEEKHRLLLERDGHLDDCKLRIAAGEEQVRVHEETAASLRADLAAKHMLAEELERKFVELREQSEAERVSLTEIHEREAALLRAEVDEVKSQLGIKAAEIESHKETSRATLSALESSVSAYKKEAESLRDDLESQAVHLRANTAQLVGHEEEVISLRGQLEAAMQWKVAYDESQATLGPAAEKAERNASTVRRLEGELEAVLRERQTATSLLDEATVALQNTRGLLAEKDAELERIRPALTAAESASEALRQHRDHTRGDLLEARSRLDAVESEAHGLRAELGKTSVHLKRIEGELEQRQEQVDFLQGVLEQVGGAQDEERVKLQEELELAKGEVIRLRQHNAEALSAEAARVTAVADDLALVQQSNAKRNDHSLAVLEAALHSERLKRAVAEELLAEAEERLRELLGAAWREGGKDTHRAEGRKVTPAFGPGVARRSLGAHPAGKKVTRKTTAVRRLAPSKAAFHDRDAIQYGEDFYTQERRRPVAKRPPLETLPRDRYDAARPPASARGEPSILSARGAKTTPRGGTSAAAPTSRSAIAALDVIYSSMRAHGVKSRARDTFIGWDADRDGTVSRVEFAGALEALGMRLTPVQLDAVFSLMDTNCNGRVSYPEFDRALRRHAASIAGAAR